MYDENDSVYVNPNSENFRHLSPRDMNYLVVEEVEIVSNEPEMKVQAINSIKKYHDRQIQRLEKDRTKRIKDYNILRNKLETDTKDLQDQINGIRTELTKLHQKAELVDEMQLHQRLIHCEEQNLQMQIHNDSEFDVLRDVLKQIYGRIERMEELHQTEREIFKLQNQQQHQQSLFKRTSAPKSPTNSSQFKSRFVCPRTKCPRCQKELCKYYLKKHLQTARCKIARTN